jgi:hypothetical protein
VLAYLSKSKDLFIVAETVSQAEKTQTKRHHLTSLEEAKHLASSDASSRLQRLWIKIDKGNHTLVPYAVLVERTVILLYAVITVVLVDQFITFANKLRYL